LLLSTEGDQKPEIPEFELSCFHPILMQFLGAKWWSLWVIDRPEKNAILFKGV